MWKSVYRMVNDINMGLIVGEINMVMMIMHAIQHKYLFKEEGSVTKLQEEG